MTEIKFKFQKSELEFDLFVILKISQYHVFVVQYLKHIKINVKNKSGKKYQVKGMKCKIK